MKVLNDNRQLSWLAGLGVIILLISGCASLQERLAQKIEYIIPKDEASPGDVFQVGFILPEEIKGGYVVFLEKKYRIFPRRDLGKRTFSTSLAIPRVDPGDYSIFCIFRAAGSKKAIQEELEIQILPDFTDRPVDKVRGRKFNSEAYLNDRVAIQERLDRSTYRPKRKQDFALPLSGEVVSTFGTIRKYGQKAEVALEGVEIKSVSASIVDINAAADGRVVMAEKLSMLGNVVLIDHGLSVATLYCHLRNMEVKAGQTVLRGDRLGLVGNSGGAAVGKRLYYQLFVSGTPVDVQSYTDINIFE